MKPGNFSVRNSLFVNLVSVMIIIVGVYYWFNIKQEAFPNVNYDKVTINTVYPGATPQEVEKLITIPLEEKLAEVDDVDEIQSSSAENISTILVQIDSNAKDTNKVVQDIQRAVDRERDLPDDIQDDPLVTEIEAKIIPVIRVSLSGLPEKELRKYVESLKDKFQDIPGVATVNKEGWHDREMRVAVDPDKVKEYYLSMNEIIAALKNKNINLPGGTLESGTKEFLIRTMGEFDTAKEIENVIIRANEEGNWIRVKDIATVRDTFEDKDVIFKTNGLESINLTVTKRESADTLKVVKGVNDTIETFLENADPQLKIATYDDISYYIKRRLKVLINNGTIGLVMLLSCLLFFLRWRTAMVTAIGLPVAFGTTLILMAFFGISINLISLFGMIIVLGMLVDDGIIIAENSYRYIEGGMLPREAAVRGVNEVAKPVIATILTTAAFFFPLLCMTGLMGKFVRHIPIVVMLMLFASLLEALFFLPSHIAEFVKPIDTTHAKKRWGDRFFHWLVRHYEKCINALVRFRYITLIVVILIAVAALYIRANFIKFQLFPSEGIEEFYISAEAPVGTRLEETELLLRPVEKLVAALPSTELDNFTTTIGSVIKDREQVAPETGTHLGQIYVYLTPEANRTRKTKDILEQLRQEVKDITGFDKLSLEEIRPGPPVGKPIAIKVRGENFGTLKDVSLQVQDFLKTIDGVRDIKDDFTEGKEELRVIIDEEKATRLFLTTHDIAFAVRYSFEGGIATTIKTTDEEIDVVVRFPEDKQLSLDTFNSIFIPNKYGKLIPLNKVATLETEKGISAINHLDRKRVITVTANVDTDITTSAEVNAVCQKHFQDIYKKYLEITITYAGEQEDTEESMRSLATAFVWGLLIVFLILASTFGSLVQPIVVLTSIPMGLIGVIYVFFLHGKPFGFMSIMGAVGLAGVAVNDSIVLVEFINHLRKEGHDRRSSIIQAGKLRIRPIILTTITTVVGLLPVAYGWGGSDPIIKSMALALAWGLVFATFSTLLFIPALYAIIDDLRSRCRKKDIWHHDTPPDQPPT